MHGQGHRVSFSIGVVTCIVPPLTVDELLSQVDA